MEGNLICFLKIPIVFRANIPVHEGLFVYIIKSMQIWTDHERFSVKCQAWRLLPFLMQNVPAWRKTNLQDPRLWRAGRTRACSSFDCGESRIPSLPVKLEKLIFFNFIFYFSQVSAEVSLWTFIKHLEFTQWRDCYS